ncbi:hypothetical protein [Deminuibacter soli]|uniref:DUF5602 domain-containing protein n=1 Tax=Deminuibacter soli TaxID=2291815 RepID=A0A3E1NLA1_9BACT|nr:hypothetical protein [Deminuibacter soli]RFM28693.1 hypothetical protein DXN05_07860 [Deminuibacter soli]
MKNLQLKSARFAALFLLLSVFLFSCTDQQGGLNTTHYGQSVSMGNGSVRSFITLNPGNIPVQIGYEITPAAIQNLPAASHEDSMIFYADSTGMGDMPMPSHEYLVPLDAAAKKYTVFDHLAANWNPLGHMPVGVYSRPHFDFHFYNMPLAEREKIPAYMDDPTGFDQLPADGYLPADYIRVPGGEARMGTHWADKTAPELNGGAFTQTFIYGSYNSKETFYEPMVTLAYLQSVTTFSGAIKQPAKHLTTGYYPTQYLIYSDASGKRYVVLTGFVKYIAN